MEKKIFGLSKFTKRNYIMYACFFLLAGLYGWGSILYRGFTTSAGFGAQSSKMLIFGFSLVLALLFFLRPKRARIIVSEEMFDFNDGLIEFRKIKRSQIVRFFINKAVDKKDKRIYVVYDENITFTVNYIYEDYEGFLALVQEMGIPVDIKERKKKKKKKK